MPQKQRKRRRLGSSAKGCTHLGALYPNHVWSYDFVADQTEDGHRLKIFVVVDEYTRRSLALEVGRRFTSEDVIDTMRVLFEIYGVPTHIRSDNGPELIANDLRRWLSSRGTGTLFIEPGSPWENAYVESFNGKLRDELLDRELLTSLLDARVLLEEQRNEHNEVRPHNSLGVSMLSELWGLDQEQEEPGRRDDPPPQTIIKLDQQSGEGHPRKRQGL